MTNGNPYSSPIPVAEHTKRLSVGRIAVIVLLMILTIPACGIAFCVTCMSIVLGSAAIFDQNFPNVPVLVEVAIGAAFLCGFLAAGAVAYGMIRAVRAVAKGPKQDSSIPHEPPT